MSFRIQLICTLGAVFFSSLSYAVPIVHTSDFINDGARINFNSFESIPNDGTFYTGGSGPYIEGGIRVQQINADPGNDIWVTSANSGRDGNFLWYPNGGDHGYTSIQLGSGLDFGNVGFLIGSGDLHPIRAYFELWNNGALVLTGSVEHQRPFHYLGFEGGGFDTIFLRDGATALSVKDGTHNALTIDAIEVSVSTVPEPRTYLMLLVGLGIISLTSRNKCIS